MSTYYVPNAGLDAGDPEESRQTDWGTSPTSVDVRSQGRVMAYKTLAGRVRGAARTLGGGARICQGDKEEKGTLGCGRIEELKIVWDG